MEIQELNEDLMWILFQGMVCTALVDAGFNGDAWNMASYLDMSFDDARDYAIEDWGSIIKEELNEYREENPDSFSKLH